MVCHNGGSIIFWPCACWILTLKKILGEILVCHICDGIQIQPAHGQKMIDPPWQTRISPRIFLKDSTWAWSKDDWPHSMTNQDLTYNFKVQNNLHMVKDDWPRRRLLHERPFTHEGNYLFLTVTTLSGWGSLERTDFNSFYFGKVWRPWKNWFLTVSTLGWCCGCERTDF